MTASSFVVPLKKWGNSYVLKIPPQVARLYEKACAEVLVTIQPYAYKCPHCGSSNLVNGEDGVVCSDCGEVSTYKLIHRLSGLENLEPKQ